MRQLVIFALIVSAGARRRHSHQTSSEDVDTTLRRNGDFHLMFSIRKESDIRFLESFVEFDTGSSYPKRRNEFDAEPGCLSTSLADQCGVNVMDHYVYRRTAVDSWLSIGVQRVRVELHTNSMLKAYLLFDGVGSDLTNWFTRERLIESTYTDLKTGGGNFFDFVGIKNTLVTRRFYLNFDWTGCAGDKGWLVVVDARGVCPWDKNVGDPSSTVGFPLFLYSPFSIKTTVQTGMEYADVLQIFVQADGLE